MRSGPSGAQKFGSSRLRRPAPVQGILPVKAIVSLEEARRFQLRYGLELSSEYTSALDQRINAVGVAADIRDRNFLGRGMSLGGGLRYEPDLRSARSLFSVPTLRRRPIRTNLFLNARSEAQQDEQLETRDDEVNLTLEQRWRVSRAIEYSWGYSSAWRDARLTDTTAQETLAFNGILASLNGAAVIDRRDSFFDAKRGWFGSASLQWGQRRFGSDVDYLRTLIRGSYYQPLGPVVLAGNVRWGQLATFGVPSTLTIFDLFFNAGGTESVRGYSQDALSAYSFADAPLGGTKLLVANAELRIAALLAIERRALRRCREHVRQHAADPVGRTWRGTRVRASHQYAVGANPHRSRISAQLRGDRGPLAFLNRPDVLTLGGRETTRASRQTAPPPI